MGDPLEDVLSRYREVWRERLWWGVVLAACAGVVLGYVVRVVYG